MKMHADEIDIDTDLVRRLLRTQLPHWADRAIEPVQPWGTDNALFRLGEDMVARLPRHAPSVGALEKECRWLPTLAPLLPVPVPVPLAEGVPGEGYPFPWAVYPWFPGENAAPDRIADPRQFAVDLAQFIAALQGMDSTGGPLPGQHNAYRGVPLEQRDAETREAIEALSNQIDSDRVTAIWEEALRAPDWQGPPVWIHGDLDARNLLVRNGRLSAVIDFGCLGIGDPACDVMVAWKLFPADARAVFREILSVDDATWARARGWVLSQALIALPYYTMETNPTLVLEARRWLAEVLTEHRSTC
jgi:aminoglycoside phosphotransferase (APT) family kinase protein